MEPRHSAPLSSFSPPPCSLFSSGVMAKPSLKHELLLSTPSSLSSCLENWALPCLSLIRGVWRVGVRQRVRGAEDAQWQTKEWGRSEGSLQLTKTPAYCVSVTLRISGWETELCLHWLISPLPTSLTQPRSPRRSRSHQMLRIPKTLISF